MNIITLLIKGFIIGIGKIIPGVSGAIMAISLGVYEKSIEILSNLFKIKKKDFVFISCLGIGFILSVILFSKVIVWVLESYYLPTILLFIGLIIGNIKIDKNIVNNKKSMFVFLFSILLIVILSFINMDNSSSYSLFMLFVMGVIEAISMIVPGLSGTALLMMFGYYELVLNAFGNIDIYVLLPFLIGVIAGAIIVSKLINYLFKNYREMTNIIISGLSISSVLVLFIQTFNKTYSLSNIIFSLFLLVIGYNLSKYMEK